jgi:hypothetical protein
LYVYQIYESKLLAKILENLYLVQLDVMVLLQGQGVEEVEVFGQMLS